MKSSTTYQPASRPAILLVGEPKVGKSSLALSFPSPYVLDFDMNLGSVTRRAPGLTFSYDTPAIRDDGTERPEHERWNAACAAVREACASPAVKTIIIDGLGLLSEALIAHIIVEVEKSGGADPKMKGKMRLQDYGPFKTLMTRFQMMLRASGKIIIFTAHQKGDKDELTGLIRYELAMPGQLAANFGGYFTDVWGMAARNLGGKIKYELLTRPSGFHVALGTSFLLEPTMDLTDKTPTQVWSLLAPKLGL